MEGCYPFEAENLISPRVSLVLKFSTGDDGYLCAAPDSVAKKAILAAKLSERESVLGIISYSNQLLQRLFRFYDL